MRKTLTLAKILRKSGAGSDESIKKSSAELATKVIFGVLGLALCALLGWIGSLLGMLDGLPNVDAKAFLQVLFMAGMVSGIFFSIPPIVNSFYMSSDIGVILEMPLSSIQIVVARTINAATFPVGLAFIFSIPAGIGYATSNAVPPSFFVALVLAFICIPLISLSAIGTIIILLMTFVKIFRNKDLLRVIGVLFVFGILIAYYLLLSRDSDGPSLGTVETVAGAMSPYVSVLPINFALRAFMESFSVIALLEILGITAAFVTLFLLVAKVFYLSGAMDMQSTGSMHKKLSAEDLRKSSGRKSAVSALTRKELRMCGRNPAYLMTGYLYTFGMPILMCIVLFMGNSQADLVAKYMVARVNNPVVEYALALGAGIMFACVSACTNAIASTAFSREGSSISVLKQLPISWNVILKAKQLAPVIICSLSGILYVVIGGGLLCYLGYLTPLPILLGLVSYFAMMMICINVNINHDIKNPNFVWESEAQMVKKSSENILAIVLMFFGILAPMIIVPIVVVTGKMGIPIVIILSALLVGGSIGFQVFTMKMGVKRLAKL